MSKKLSLILVCVLSALILVAAIFAFIPSYSVGEYGVKYSPIEAMQKGLFASQQKASYKVSELAEGKTLENSNVTSIISKRLAKIYNYYGAKFVIDGDSLDIIIPESLADKAARQGNTLDETNIASATEILSSVICQGKVEILDDTSYDKECVMLTAEHFASAKTSKYVSDSNVYYIVDVKLTKEGKGIAAKNLQPASQNWSAYCSVDEVVSYGVAYVNDGLQIYTNSDSQAAALKSYINYGALDGKLDETASVAHVEGSGTGFIVLGIVLAVLMIAGWVYMFIRYGKLAIVNVVATLFSAMTFIWFAGGVYFNCFNAFAYVGVIISLAIIDYITYVQLDAIKSATESGKKSAPAIKGAFNGSFIKSLIVCGGAIVLGIICWFIPTVVTAPLGNALVYGGVLAFAALCGINRLSAHAFAD